MITAKDLRKISDNIWEIPRKFRRDIKENKFLGLAPIDPSSLEFPRGGEERATGVYKDIHDCRERRCQQSGKPKCEGYMLVPARVYASAHMLEEIFAERALEQLINMTTLPGIARYALAMPDIHQGYGFPIGAVAAFRLSDGIISPGGVGYDINCGVRLLASAHKYAEIKPHLEALISNMQRDVPSGVGSSGTVVLNEKELDKVLNHGLEWAIKNNHALSEDAEFIEEHGCFVGANAAMVSVKAKKRGSDQLGTLGAGNHFLEIQKKDIEDVVAVVDAENIARRVVKLVPVAIIKG